MTRFASLDLSVLSSVRGGQADVVVERLGPTRGTKGTSPVDVVNAVGTFVGKVVGFWS